MLPLIWLLFVFPAYTLLILYAGAHIFHSGAQGKSPIPTMPRFDLSRRPKTVAAGKNGDNRLPEV